MSDRFLAGFALGVVLASLTTGFTIGMSVETAERQKAIEAGYGYHKIDAETGVKEFVYGPIPKESE